MSVGDISETIILPVLKCQCGHQYGKNDIAKQWRYPCELTDRRTRVRWHIATVLTCVFCSETRLNTMYIYGDAHSENGKLLMYKSPRYKAL